MYVCMNCETGPTVYNYHRYFYKIDKNSTGVYGPKDSGQSLTGANMETSQSEFGGNRCRRTRTWIKVSAHSYGRWLSKIMTNATDSFSALCLYCP